MIRLKYYPHHNPLIDGQAILHSYKEELMGVGKISLECLQLQEQKTLSLTED